MIAPNGWPARADVREQVKKEHLDLDGCPSLLSVCDSRATVFYREVGVVEPQANLLKFAGSKFML